MNTLSPKPLSPEIQHRLQTEANIWVATVRSDGRPHLTPVWFAWHAKKIYICIQGKSVKAKNFANNPKAALSLEDGSKVVICEGTATSLPLPWPAAVAAIFQEKHGWDITTDGDYDRLVEITPVKWLIW
ncbi:MAG: pyridoxamine 5'-phosphate oxidase family protein [Anaerolineae bacterium]|nr:pyridoxamine 5'-phosphate oxidase family protein [Anaerolineae bacterium]